MNRASELAAYIESLFPKDSFPNGVPVPSAVTHYWTPAQAGQVANILSELQSALSVDDLSSVDRATLREAATFLRIAVAQWQQGSWKPGSEPTLQARHVAAIYHVLKNASQSPPAPVTRQPLAIAATDPFLAKLASLVPGAAASYRQAVEDLKEDRLSYRGPANELRQALWETLQVLAPDEDVVAEPGFRQAPGTHGPTHAQRAAYILRKRRGADLTENAVAALSAVARETYVKSNDPTHNQREREEALQAQRWVEVVLRELLA